MKNILTSLLVISSLIPISAQAKGYLCEDAVNPCVNTACKKYIENLKGVFVDYLSSECLAKICDGGTGTVVTVYDTGGSKDKKYWNEVFTPTKADVCEDYYNKRQKRQDEMDKNGAKVKCIVNKLPDDTEADKYFYVDSSVDTPLACVRNVCKDFVEKYAKDIHSYTNYFEEQGKYVSEIQNGILNECLNKDEQAHKALKEKCANIDKDDTIKEYYVAGSFKEGTPKDILDKYTLIKLKLPEDNTKEATYLKYSDFDERFLCPTAKDVQWDKWENDIFKDIFKNAEFFFFAFSPNSFKQGEDYEYPGSLDFISKKCSSGILSTTGPSNSDVLNETLQNNMIGDFGHNNLNCVEYFLTYPDKIGFSNTMNNIRIDTPEQAAQMMTKWFGGTWETSYENTGLLSGTYVKYNKGFITKRSTTWGILSVNYGCDIRKNATNEIITPHDYSKASQLFNKLERVLSGTACAVGFPSNPYLCLVAVVRDEDVLRPDGKTEARDAYGELIIKPTGTFSRKVVRCEQLK
ncbi:MAG: hypothetical protein K5912_01265 [Alphaproteobacteria bacterium]|nr:hypothetical protein [Alphaproteobacteria bacterium]